MGAAVKTAPPSDGSGPGPRLRLKWGHDGQWWVYGPEGLICRTNDVTAMALVGRALGAVVTSP